MGDTRNAYKILVGQHEKKASLERPKQKFRGKH
jgi:hypothetical protein